MQKQPVKERLNKYISDDLIKYARYGMSIPWISRKLGIEEQKLERIFFYKLIEHPKFSRKKYYCNYDFFKKIDTEDKAYWLGFLYADGCITKTAGINLLLSSEDRDHLEKYKKSLEAEHPIEDRIQFVKHYKEDRLIEQKSSKIRLFSSEMVEDLKNLGCMRLKTFKLKFPTSDQVPDHLIRHFIRGYFDGDGSIWVSEYKGKYKKWGFTILGNEDFCKKCKSIIFNQCGVSLFERKHQTTDGIIYIYSTNVIDINKIKNFLYNNAKIFLSRKLEKFNNLPQKEYNGDIGLLRNKLICCDHFSDIEFDSFSVSRFFNVSLLIAQNVLKEFKDCGKIIVTRHEERHLYYKIKK